MTPDTVRAVEKGLVALLIGLYACAMALALVDALGRVGAPDIGWMMDGPRVAPTRRDAEEAGIVWGGRATRVNGVALNPRLVLEELATVARRTEGATNTVTLDGAGGATAEVTVTVQRLTWADVLYAEGPLVGLGALFFGIGVTSFVLRPFAASSWALLALCSIAGGLETTLLLPITPGDPLQELYFRIIVGLVSVVPLHAALAFPVVHPLLLRRPRVLAAIYAVGVGVAALQFGAWYGGWRGSLQYAGGGLDTSVLLLSIIVFLGRCLKLARPGGDPVITQRARILLVGTLGVVPFVVVNFVSSVFHVLLLDMRVAHWAMSLFVLAFGYVTVRQDILNARIAVRRAMIYAAVVTVLTVLAVLLLAVSTYAVAVLLFPLLYVWPRFAAALDARLYPQRARFPELIRTIGQELTACASEDAVLETLAQAPLRLCDARSAAVFLLPDSQGRAGRFSSTDPTLAIDVNSLADEAVVRLLVTTRKDVSHDQIAVDPLYSNIKADCDAFLQRLGADVLLPLVRDSRVIGALALGHRTTGDVYETADLDALATVAQQAVQAIARVEATERLRTRETEFADLKRFFPPQIIDQVMARGGAAELQSQRKLVTVVFADLRGFTTFSDTVEPEEVLATLAEYHAAMGWRIAEFAGTLERFVGDGFMVFFNDPVDQPDHVEPAVRMTAAMQVDIQRLREGWVRKGYQIDVGMGIHTGYATCGFIGYEGRRDYAVIGNVTNLAARLSDAAAGGEVLISARVCNALSDGYETAAVGELALKGFRQAQAVYRLVFPNGA